MKADALQDRWSGERLEEATRLSERGALAASRHDRVRRSREGRHRDCNGRRPQTGSLTTIAAQRFAKRYLLFAHGTVLR